MAEKVRYFVVFIDKQIERERKGDRGVVEISDRAPGMTLLERSVNGRPGLVAQRDGVTVTVAAFGLTGDRITRIWAVRNPEKLRPWSE